MKNVRSRLSRYDDLATGLPAVFRGICSRENFEFAYSIQNRPVQWLICRLVVVVDAVKDVLVCNFAVSRDIQPAAETNRRVLRRREDVRLQECELKIVAAIQR